jgi:hypothetical protein
MKIIFRHAALLPGLFFRHLNPPEGSPIRSRSPTVFTPALISMGISR